MGATHKETVTEIVKAMIQANHIKSDPKSEHPERDILRKSIMLVEYGVQIYRDPNTTAAVLKGYAKEINSVKPAQKIISKQEPRVTNDLNTLKKKLPERKNK